jgi:hypothetical protein
VAGSAIPNPLSGEFGIVGYYSAVNDTIWFGTNMGRVYRSTDRGLTYTVSTVTPLNGKYIEPSFRTGTHGLVQDKSAGTTGAMCETFDGGQTWTTVNATGPVYATDLLYVPGTANTWVSSGSSGNMGSSYSFDGGHTWSPFLGTDGAAYMQMTWVNNHCGWAGGVNSSATENGAYKFIGLLRPALPAPLNLQGVVTNHDVHLTWEAPSGTPLGYNLYRNGLKLNASPITALFYDDLFLISGQYTYCVKAVYTDGESDEVCTIVDVAVGIKTEDVNDVRITPNPASEWITITGITSGRYEMLNLQGVVVLSGDIDPGKSGVETAIYVGALSPGYFLLRFPGHEVAVRVFIRR